MRLTAAYVTCVWVLSSALVTPAAAQLGQLPDIRIPVAAAQPRISATVSLVSGSPPAITSGAFQFDVASGLTIMTDVSPQDAALWTLPGAVLWAPPRDPRLTQNLTLDPGVPGADEPRAREPEAVEAGEPVLLEPVVPAGAGATAKPTRPRSPLLWRPPPPGASAYSDSVASPGATTFRRNPTGVVLKSETREVAFDGEEIIEFNWPDDRPRYYLEQQGDDLFRRVQLADKDGYTVTLRATQVGAIVSVELDMARKTLTGGRYDETINAYVGKPTLIKTICTTSAPVDLRTAGTATVVTWGAPTGRGMDAALARAQYERSSASVEGPGAGTGSGLDPATAQALFGAGFIPFAGAAEAGAVAPTPGVTPGLAIVLCAETGAHGPAPGGEDEPEDAAAELGKQVQVDLKFVEIAAGSPELDTLAAGGPALSPEAADRLQQLIDGGQVRVIASPKLITLDNQLAELEIGQVEPYIEGLEEADVPVGIHIGVTPRVQPDGRVLLTLETRFDELLDTVLGAEGENVPMLSTRQANVRLKLPDGQTGVVGGLVRMHRMVTEAGKMARQPVETLIFMTPRVLDQNK